MMGKVLVISGLGKRGVGVVDPVQSLLQLFQQSRFLFGGSDIIRQRIQNVQLPKGGRILQQAVQRHVDGAVL